MQAYLSEFLTACEYCREDTVFLCEIYSRIAANDTAAKVFAEALSIYDRETPCDYERILRLADDAAQAVGIHAYTAELLVFLCMTKTLRERYRTRNIDEAIFYNSVLDLRYKLEECKAVKGIIGSFVAPWFAGFFDMTRFALGRLQFELIPFENTYEKDGKQLTPDSRVINVHIPRTGTPLAENACEAAYAQAANFFADEISGDIAFVCHSWLLYPENETILSPQSNIVRFMKRYDVVRWGIDKHQNDLWRLFDTDERHPDRLPADTTARRLYAEHLKAGGNVGWGAGVFFI